ncbi:MAG: hypothetical protein ABFD81_15050 [Syntrophaceae bacterium]
MSSREEKREDLLKKAAAVLPTIGPDKTTLEDIAKQAGPANTSFIALLQGQESDHTSRYQARWGKNQ